MFTTVVTKVWSVLLSKLCPRTFGTILGKQEKVLYDKGSGNENNAKNSCVYNSRYNIWSVLLMSGTKLGGVGTGTKIPKYKLNLQHICCVVTNFVL